MGVIRRMLASKPVAHLTSPHSVDHFLEHVHPLWTAEAVRARVVRVDRETGSASTVWLKPNGAWTGFKPGQHVEFGVEVNGTRRVRVFSVSSSQHRTDGLVSVSVKAHPDGFVSQFLHDGRLSERTVIHMSPASGEFILPRHLPEHLVLISGGSGITPVMSMLRTLTDKRAKRQFTGRITFLHYARSRDDEMFSAELDQLAAHPQVDMTRIYTREADPTSELQGRFRVEHLKHLGVEQSPAWVCGPAGLIATVRDTYDELGVPLTFEYFKVPAVDLDAADATGTLTFEASDTAVENSGATILEQAEAAGLQPEYGCRMGVCNTCAVKKLHGAVRHVITDEINANTDETIKVCVTVPVGNVAVNL